MPLLTAIDEYDCTIRMIAAHAATALLSSDTASQDAAALRFIVALCQKTDEVVEGVLNGPLAALATALCLRQCPL